MHLSPGTLVYAHREAGVARKGEVGVCYEVYTLKGESGEEPGYGLIFERGGHDGFSLFDLTVAVTPLQAQCSVLQTYRAANVGNLRRDYQAGVFQGAFLGAEDYLTAHGWLRDRQRSLLWLHEQVHQSMSIFLSALETAFSARVTLEADSIRNVHVTLLNERGEEIVLPAGYEPGWSSVRRNVASYLAPLRGTFHYYLRSPVSQKSTFKDAFVIPYPSLTQLRQEHP